MVEPARTGSSRVRSPTRRPETSGLPIADRDATRASQTGEQSPSGSPGVVVLSIEPAGAGPGTDTEVPVVFPGYVLPDDSLEDSAHEGS